MNGEGGRLAPFSLLCVRGFDELGFEFLQVSFLEFEGFDDLR